MTKRIIVAILIFALVFSITGFSSENTEKIQSLLEGKSLLFAKAVGLIDNDVLGVQGFSRAELAKLVTRILVSQTGTLDVQYENIFSDVKSSDVPYVMAATDLGILNGVGGGLFAPDENVTYIQFLKAMVVLLGRESEATVNGGYPLGYYFTANKLGLTKNAPPDINYELTYDGVANILKLMQNTNLIVFENDGKPVYLNESYLEYYMGIDFVSGIISSIDGVSMSEQEGATGIVRIGNDIHPLKSDLKDMGYLLGYRVDAYFKTRGTDANEVFFIDDYDNTVVTIDAEEISGVEADKICYIKNNKEIKLNFNSSTTRLIYNNKYEPTYSIGNINPFSSQRMDGNIILIDNNGDKVYDIVRVKAYKTYVVDKVVNDIVYNRYNKTEYVDLSQLEKNAVVNVIMQQISPDLIESGDLISVMKDVNGDIQTVIVTIDTYEGVIQEIENENGRISGMKIDSLSFNVAYSFENSPNSDKVKPGQRVRVYLNPEGRISDINTEDYESYRIGYFIDAKIESGMDKSCKALILTASGDVNSYLLKEKIKTHSSYGSEQSVKSEDFLNDMIGFSDGRYVRQPIMYKLTPLNEISYIRQWHGTDTTQDGFYQYPDFDGVGDNINSENYYWRGGTNSFGTRLLVSGTTIMFSVPREEDRDKYDFYMVTSPSHFIYNGIQRESVEAYGTKKYNPVAEIMIVYNNATFDNTSTVNDAIVVSNVSTISENGEEFIKIEGFSKGTEVVFKAEPSAATCIIPGDIVKVYTSSESIVRKTEKIFSYSDKIIMPYDSPESESVTYFHPGGNIPTIRPMANNRYIYSKVFWNDDYAITLKLDDTYNLDGNDATDFVYENYPITKSGIIIIDTKGRELTIKKGSVEDILSTINNSSENASNIFIHTKYGACQSMVIYN